MYWSMRSSAEPQDGLELAVTPRRYGLELCLGLEMALALESGLEIAVALTKNRSEL